MSSIFCRLPLVTLQLSDVGPEDWARVRPYVVQHVQKKNLCYY